MKYPLALRHLFIIACTIYGSAYAEPPPTINANFESQSGSICDTVTEIPKSECDALVALYNSTGGDNWTDHTGWNVTNMPCSWYGVSCSGGHVSQLSLSSNQLTGTIPPELGQLSNLTRLYLYSNQLCGKIPSELMNLTNLYSPPNGLNLENNNLIDYDTAYGAGFVAWLDQMDPDWRNQVSPSYCSLLHFSAACYCINEGDGSATITVIRSGASSQGAVSVDYAICDTATAGCHYGTLNWVDGDSTDKTFTVDITDDSEPENGMVQNKVTSNVFEPCPGKTLFIVSLGNPAGAQLGVPNTAEVTIKEKSNTLSVTKSGSGSGQVTSSPAGIDCGTDCSEDYNYGTEVTLTATPEFRSIFIGWSGSCTGSSCSVTMDTNHTVNAHFETETDDLIIDFGSQYGIWAWMNNDTWTDIHTLSPKSMNIGDIDDSGQDDIIIDFGSQYGIWLWMNNNTWVSLHSFSADSMTTGDIDGGSLADIIIDFGSQYGIWVRMNNSEWTQLHTLSPETMTTGDMDGGGLADIIIDFGETYGIWVRMNDSSWVKLHSLSAESITTGDMDGGGLDDVIIDFGESYGIWVRMNNSDWAQLHSLSPESMTTGDMDGNGLDEVIIDFGSQYGIWVRMNNSDWTQLHSLSPESMTTGYLDKNAQADVIIDFGEPDGIWVRMNNDSWVKLHSISAEGMVTGNIDGLPSLSSNNITTQEIPAAELDNGKPLPFASPISLPKPLTTANSF